MVGDPPLLSSAAAAAKLGVSIRTLHRWIRAGHLPASYTPGGYARLKAADVARVLSADRPARPRAGGRP